MSAAHDAIRDDDLGADLLERLRRAGALLEGHFELSSGRHSPFYVQCALLLQHPDEARAVGESLAQRVRDTLRIGEAGGTAVSAVVSPALGGVVIGHELGRALGARAIFAERQDGRLALRRGFAVDAGEPAVICEDVVTTGGSVREVAGLVRAAGGSVLGFAALLDRAAAPLDLGAPLAALARLSAPTYTAAECPQCAAGSKAVKPGSRGTLSAASQ